MKTKIYSLALILLVTGISGCLKSTTTVTQTVNIPAGSFSGKFTYLHRKVDNLPFDTLSASIVLSLSATDGTYAVTGDTSTVHAGSKGVFQANSSYMNFIDSTLPKSGISTKKHLNGTYIYAYDGTTLKMFVNQSDTVSFQYQLTKSN